MSLIYVDKRNMLEREFVSLLSETKRTSLAELKRGRIKRPKEASEEFEELIYEQMRESAHGTDFANRIVHTTSHAFPDIVANKYFGVEVKMTSGDKWVSLGNSVLEGTRAEDIRKIYLMFGKLGGGADIDYRPYQECLYDIGVTHSPRYKIDMKLPPGASIFDKMGVDYDALRSSKNPISHIKDYYRKLLGDGEELWWIDQRGEDPSVSPVIKPFRSLSILQKARFMAEAMILFPEIFGSSSLKFERPAAYLVADHNVILPNVRDVFTAGGRKTLTINGKSFSLSKIDYHLFESSLLIKSVIQEIESEKLRHYWRVKKIEEDRLGQWLGLCREYFTGRPPALDIADIFESGLRKDAKDP